MGHLINKRTLVSYLVMAVVCLGLTLAASASCSIIARSPITWLGEGALPNPSTWVGDGVLDSSIGLLGDKIAGTILGPALVFVYLELEGLYTC